MQLTWRDWVATGCVVVAALMYGVWLSQGEVLGISSERMLGLIVLLLGLVASVTAVVFGVGEGLLRAPKLYLTVTSLIGLVALVAGVLVLVNESEAMLATLVGTTVALWMVSTVRHAMAQERGGARHGLRGSAA
jgi:hypothetical protein